MLRTFKNGLWETFKDLVQKELKVEKFSLSFNSIWHKNLFVAPLKNMRQSDDLPPSPSPSQFLLTF